MQLLWLCTLAPVLKTARFSCTLAAMSSLHSVVHGTVAFEHCAFWLIVSVTHQLTYDLHG